MILYGSSFFIILLYGAIALSLVGVISLVFGFLLTESTSKWEVLRFASYFEIGLLVGFFYVEQSFIRLGIGSFTPLLMLFVFSFFWLLVGLHLKPLQKTISSHLLQPSSKQLPKPAV